MEKLKSIYNNDNTTTDKLTEREKIIKLAKRVYQCHHEPVSAKCFNMNIIIVNKDGDIIEESVNKILELIKEYKNETSRIKN